MRSLIILLLALPAPVLTGSPAPEALKLLISVEQQMITAPYPAVVTLHFHNSGRETLWLYQRARDQATDGSTLEARLEPMGAPGAADNSTPAQGKVFEKVGFPHPKLVKLAPDDDTTEKTVLKILPARTATDGEGTPVWGRYRFSVTYKAEFSNAAEIRRNLGAILWQGEVTSNSIDLDLQPPTGQGSVAGSVRSNDGRPLHEVLASLADEGERLVSQTLTDLDGRFSFTQLPSGKYWVTVRRPDFNEDTVVFRHVAVTAAEPAGAIDFVLTPPEMYEAAGLLHKPVLFLVTDSAGHPLEKASLEATWSSGTVLDDVKAETPSDGMVAMDLIPGRSFVTLKRRGCPKEESRADVASGGVVDGFKLTSACARP